MTVLKTLVSFNGSNGAGPQGDLIADASGNLFGTTSGGGGSNAGTVFEIAKTATGYAGSPITLVSFEVVKTAAGYASTPTTLVSFNGANGRSPSASLIADANGNLFGTTQLGGAF